MSPTIRSGLFERDAHVRTAVAAIVSTSVSRFGIAIPPSRTRNLPANRSSTRGVIIEVGTRQDSGMGPA
uniref:RxLR effector candidate protein n=1 Tax=Hyaloperonospora arabidopsidis (strain Emoy2) TaxID=559515 RepID=M4BW51_HYAAE